MKRPAKVLVAAAAALLLSPAFATAAEWSCRSGSGQATLLELYTSQGCSSCPPADRWLSEIRNRDDLWTGVVPVAWHVTYWDYIGWRDPFAKPENDRRQRATARAARSQVYTPGLFANREEYRQWRRLPPGGSTDSPLEVGVLSARGKGREITVQFTPDPGIVLENPRVELTYLRSGQHTLVDAGENTGRRLRNDFVAGKLVSAPLTPGDSGWSARLRLAPEAASEAVALWVLDANDNVLQATGTWVQQ